MTIIQNQNLSASWRSNRNSNLLIASLIVFLIFLSIGGIFIYNKTVNINHGIENQKIVLRDVEVRNAELKNKVYDMFNQENIREIVDSQALVIDKNPEYVKTRSESKEIGLAN